jgi:Ca-activated chloride channel homolog
MPEPSSTSRVGLFTQQGASVPLSGIDVRADVSGFCARVTLMQRYVNREASPIEAVYVFPLDEGAAVCGFEAVIDGTLVVGEVKERDQAFEMYDDAMMRGDGALLLDEERPDVFIASVGNLPPGRELLLKIVYVTELHVDDEGLRFVVPTTVSPRYAPAVDRTGVGRPDADTLNPPVTWKVPYGLNLVVSLTLPDALSRVESPTHPIRVSLNGPQATVTLSQADAALDRDFVLIVGVPNIDVPRAWIERDEDGNEAAAVGFYPRLENRSVPSEVIFLVDRSGSMGGSSIEEVRNALQLCLRSMTPGCRFNIIGYGSTFKPLFPESRAYDDASLADASAHVAGFQADMGGTEVLPALASALESPQHESLPRQVLVLTDGQVTNTDAVLALASEHAHHARIFAFGIGAGASHHLVRGLARAGRGAAEFIHPGERIEPKVVRQFGRMLSPALADVRVDWGGLSATQAPSVVPPVFAGARLVLYAFVNEAGPTTIRLTASSPAGPIAFEVPFLPGQAAPGRTIATLAARARIRELEETPEWARQRGSQQKRGTSGISREIIALSTRYNLMSRETSFVAIERRETPVLGDVQLRRVPVALTNGWGNLKEVGLSLQASAVMGSFDPLDTGSWSLADLGVVRASMPRASRLGSALSAITRRAWKGTPERKRMHALAALQRADGTWDLTSELASALGYELAALEASLPAAAGRDRDEIRSAWATALAIVWLHEEASTLNDEWRALVRKARARLDASPRPDDGSSWIAAAGAFYLHQPQRSSL